MKTLCPACSSTPDGGGVPAPNAARPASVRSLAAVSQEPWNAASARSLSGVTIFSAPRASTTSAAPAAT
jgi:hypothetical protein